MSSLLGLVAAIFIIYLAYVQLVKVDRDGPSDVEEQLQMIDEVQRTQAPPIAPTPWVGPTPFPTPTPTSAGTPTGGLRAPIDRTRQVLDTVRQRAEEQP